MALDLESLRYNAGYNSNLGKFSSVGRNSGSKAWSETYDKIMNSKESVSFYLVAAQEHLDSIIANEFALRTGMENLSKENRILKIIRPLANSQSTEANNIYQKITDTLGVRSMENVIDKVKKFGKNVWKVIKEAFKKLRLIFVNIMKSIHKWIQSVLNGGDTKELLDKWSEVTQKANKSNKTIKTLAFSPKRWLKIPNLFKFIDAITTAESRMSGIAEQTSGILANKSGNFDGKNVVRDINQVYNAITTYSGGNDGQLFGQSSNRKTANVVKIALYGVPKPVNHDISIKLIISYSDARKIIEKETFEKIKQLSTAMDKSVAAISKILSAIEKIEKEAELPKSNGKVDEKAKKAQTATLTTIRALKDAMIGLSMVGKDIFIEFVTIRKAVIRAAKTALNEEEKKD